MMVHVYTEYNPNDQDTCRRMAVARSTWIGQHWQEKPVRDDQLPRMFNEENRRFPYIKDVFNFGCQGLQNDDLVVYTNADISVSTDASVRIAAALQGSDAVYCYRRDFNHRMNEPMRDQDIQHGDNYVGSDLKAFRVLWWLTWRDDFPDLLLGMEGWDPCMRILMEETNRGSEVALSNISYHERHGSFWENQSNRYRLNAQRHNLRLIYQWLMEMGRNPEHFGIKWI